MRECCIDTLVLCTLHTSRIDESEDDICVTQSSKCLSIDESVDLIGFLTPELLTRIVMYPWCIEEYDLDSLLYIGINPRDCPLSGLWTIGYRTHSLSDEGVDESGFPSIWATDDSDISDFWHVIFCY
jgi:hypothetical protein